MKEQIEKKLGCTIEEYIKKEDDIYNGCGDLECDWDDPFTKLTNEEIDFYADYIKSLKAA